MTNSLKHQPANSSEIKINTDKYYTDSDELVDLLHGLTDKNESIRESSFKTLESISVEQPQSLFKHWEFLTDLLKSANTYHKYEALHLIANLTAADPDNRFNAIFDEFFNLIFDKSIVIVNHLLIVAPQIAKNKPDLRRKILKILLEFNTTPTLAKHKELSKAYVIQALEQFRQLGYRDKTITDFVKNGLNSSSPKTKQAAQQFLNNILE